MKQASPETAWRSLARRVAWKVNAGWLLEGFVPVVVAGSMLGALLILLLRGQGVAVTAGASWPWVAAGLLLLTGMAWWRVRDRFETVEDGLVRLESRYSMKNALTAAQAGVAPWPEAPSALRADVSWRWYWLLLPVVTCVVFLGLAWWLPIGSLQAAGRSPSSEPLAWPQMENWLKTLEEEAVVQPEALEAFEERLEELRNTPQDEWFDHAAMEASDSLRQELGQAAQQLRQDLESAERSLNALEHFGGELHQETRNQLMQSFQEAVKNLGLGNLPLNQELLDELKGLDPGQIKQLGGEQLDKLRESLREKAQAAAQAGGQELGAGLSEDEQELQQLIDQFTRNSGPGCSGDQHAPG